VVEPSEGFAPSRSLRVMVTQGENGAADTTEYVFKDKDAWAQSFRTRYSRSTEDKDAAERILKYICRMWDEYMNSEHPAGGFQRIVTKMCCKPQCDKFNRCMADSCTK